MCRNRIWFFLFAIFQVKLELWNAFVAHSQPVPDSWSTTWAGQKWNTLQFRQGSEAFNTNAYRCISHRRHCEMYVVAFVLDKWQVNAIYWAVHLRKKYIYENELI